MMKRGKILLTSLAIILLTLGLSACEQEGPAERAGEKVDEAAERAKESVDPQGPAERAGEKADEAMERADEATEERTQQ
jgi:hypothetical protein